MKAAILFIAGCAIFSTATSKSIRFESQGPDFPTPPFVRMVPLDSVAQPRDNVPQAPSPPHFPSFNQGFVPPFSHSDDIHFPALHPAQESAIKHDIHFLKHYIPALHNVLKDLEQLVDDGNYQSPPFAPFEVPDRPFDGPFALPGGVPPHFRQPIEIQPNLEINNGPTFKAPHFIKFHPNSIVFPDSPVLSQPAPTLAQFGAPPPSVPVPSSIAPPPLFHSENAADIPIHVAAVPLSLSQPAAPTPVVQNTAVPAANIPSAPKA